MLWQKKQCHSLAKSDLIALNAISFYYESKWTFYHDLRCRWKHRTFEIVCHRKSLKFLKAHTMITYDQSFSEQWLININIKGALWFMFMSHSFHHISMWMCEQMCMKQLIWDICYPSESSCIKQWIFWLAAEESQPQQWAIEAAHRVSSACDNHQLSLTFCFKSWQLLKSSIYEQYLSLNLHLQESRWCQLRFVTAQPKCIDSIYISIFLFTHSLKEFLISRWLDFERFEEQVWLSQCDILLFVKSDACESIQYMTHDSCVVMKSIKRMIFHHRTFECCLLLLFTL